MHRIVIRDFFPETFAAGHEWKIHTESFSWLCFVEWIVHWLWYLWLAENCQHKLKYNDWMTAPRLKDTHTISLTCLCFWLTQGLGTGRRASARSCCSYPWPPATWSPGGAGWRGARAGPGPPSRAASQCPHSCKWHMCHCDLTGRKKLILTGM